MSFGNVLDREKILEISRKISNGNPMGTRSFILFRKFIKIILEIVLIGKCPSLVLILEVKYLSERNCVELIMKLKELNLIKAHFHNASKPAFQQYNNGETQSLFLKIVKFSNFQKIFCKLVKHQKSNLYRIGYTSNLGSQTFAQVEFLAKNVSNLVVGFFWSKSPKFQKILFSLNSA